MSDPFNIFSSFEIDMNTFKKKIFLVFATPVFSNEEIGKEY